MTLQIALLGGLTTTETPGGLLTGTLNRRAELLLAYVAEERRAQSREAIATLFWEDESQERALSDLRTLLTRLGRPGSAYLEITRHTIAPGPQIALDTDPFQQLPPAADLPAWEALAAAYRGDFLAGVPLGRSRGLEEWVLLRRERYRARAAEAHRRLALAYLHRHDPAHALHHAEQLCALDPLREDAHRLLMRLHLRNGQPNAALAQYQKLAQLLAEELQIEPDAASQRMLRSIRALRDAPPRPLPIPDTALFGRTAELTAVAERLDDPHCRLLTIVGPGGVGKTRLALETAEALRADFPDGVWFAPLDEIDRSARFAHLLAETLELPAEAAAQPAQALAGRELLLILDNAEHLLPGLQAPVDALLRQAPTVKLLVTSRQPLELTAEWVLRLDGLPYSCPDDPAPALFSDRARRRDPAFFQIAPADLPPTTADAVRRICALLDGLPLGIELAAGLLPARSAEETAQLLAHSLDAPSSTLYGRPARQSSLRAVLDSSWALLPPPQQTLLAALAVFEPGFTAEAAADLSGRPTLLAALIERSLVRAHGRGGYALPHPVRLFALEQLAAADRETERRRQQRRFYADLLADRAALLAGPQAAEAAAALAQARLNLEAAWRSAVAAADWETLDRMLDPLHRFYEVSSRFHAARQLFADALTAAPPADRRLRGRLAARLGYHCERDGDYAAAETALATAQALLADEPTATADYRLALTQRAELAFSRGELPNARALFEQALAQQRAAADPAGAAHCLSHLGYTLVRLGEPTAAQAAFEESIAVWRRLDAPRDLAIALSGLAELLEQTAQLAEAEQIFQEALTLTTALGDVLGQALTCRNLGRLALRRQNHAQAVAYLERGLAVNAEAGGDLWPEGVLRAALGEVALATGDADAAQAAYARVLSISRELGDRNGCAVAQLGLGRAALLTAEAGAALAPLRAALEESLAVGWVPLAVRAVVHLGEAAAALGRPETAGQLWQLAAGHPAADPEQRREAERLLAHSLRRPSAPPPLEEVPAFLAQSGLC